MDNRRNYYRILEVQPDAPQEVIGHNYKVLMRKLRMHPDYGGAHRNAALINIAYETLRDPQKRESYDKKLLLKNNIVQISQGHLARGAIFPQKRKHSPASFQNENQRNYYRILQVQPDAHAAIIRERYLYMLENSDVSKELLHEAYVVLNNAQQRILYDRLLKKEGHLDAAKKLQKIAEEYNQLSKNKTIYSPAENPYLDVQDKIDLINKLSISADDSISSSTDRETVPLITNYCAFCKTPHDFLHNPHFNQFCPICSSPLFSSEINLPDKGSRSVARMQKSGDIFFSVYWPGPRLKGHILDLSPQGLRFSTDFGLDVGQIIKIEGEKLKAVAEVVHSSITQFPLTISGVRFRTVAFNSTKGIFLRALT